MIELRVFLVFISFFEPLNDVGGISASIDEPNTWARPKPTPVRKRPKIATAMLCMMSVERVAPKKVNKNANTIGHLRKCVKKSARKQPQAMPKNTCKYIEL